MSFVNIAEWTPRHVVQWLQGLERCIQPYVQFFFDNQINGTRLLSLTYEDLEKIYITKIGHQEIILDSVDLLKHLHYTSVSENLQSLALKLGCKSRSLYNYLKKEANCGKCENCRAKLNEPPQPEYDENEENQLIYSNLFPQYKKSNVVRKPMPDKKMCRKISTFTIASVCDILISVKHFVNWIDRYSFERLDHYTLIRQTILRISIELASTTQRDHFVENPKAIIIYNCLKFANICDTIVQELNDSLAIQAASLEMVPIKRKEDEELGVNIHSSYRGVHIIGNIKIQSPAHRCGRIEEGDEIIQINYQTVIGWQQRQIILAMAEYPTKIVLTVKKRPSHSRIAGQLRVLEPTKIPHRQVCIKTLSPLALVELSYLLDDLPKDVENNVKHQENAKEIEVNLVNNVVDEHEHEKENQRIYGNLNATPSSISQSSICIQNHDDKECCEQNTNQHKQLIEQMSIEMPAKGPVYQMSNKPKKLKRRATIHGLTNSSPTALNPPIRIEDLVNLNNTENYCSNLNKSIKTSNLTTMNESMGDKYMNGSISANSNLYKSFNNLCSTNVDYMLDDQLNPTIIRRDPKLPLNKRTCSEDDSQFIKRTVSVCYNEVHGVNNEFYLTNNYLSLPKSNKQYSAIDKRLNAGEDNQDEEFNHEETNYCFSRNKHNNATVIKVNSSPSNSDTCSKSSSKSSLPFVRSSDTSSDQFINFDQVNESYDHYDEAIRKVEPNLEIKITSDNKNIVHVSGKEQLNADSSNDFNKTEAMMNSIIVKSRQSKNETILCNRSSLSPLAKRSPNQQENDDLKIDKKQEKLEDFTQDEKYGSNKTNAQDEECSKLQQTILKPEVLRRKKSLNKQAKLIKSKNLNCFQLLANSDHNGWLYYLREELNVAKSSQPNFELNFNKQEDIKWRENFLILKHELLYFYVSDDNEQQPCRIINLPTFELDNDLEYRSGKHIFKIKSQKYRFHFASNDLNFLNEWIVKFKEIFKRKIERTDETNSMVLNKTKTENTNFQAISNQYHSFNNQVQRSNFKNAHSFRDLNLDSNSEMNHLNGLMSKSNAFIVMANDKQKINRQQTNHIDSQQCESHKTGAKYFNNGSYLRSQSCVDSEFLNKYTKARLMNRDLRETNESKVKVAGRMSSIDNLNSILPPSSAAPRKVTQSDYNSFNEQNQINQFNEQNQLNRQQEQLNQIKKEIPKPQPRMSKLKEQNANFVGKIINSFDELSKQCEKELEHYSSLRKRNGINSINDLNGKTVNELNQINSNFNSYPRNLNSTIKKDSSTPVDVNSNSDVTNQTKYISVLDREYNRLFKEKNPPQIKPIPVQTATSKEIQSIYLKQHENPNAINISSSDKCHSPHSDHSLSSSSGISSYYSYYSMGQDMQTAYSSNNFSPGSKNSSFEQSGEQLNQIKIDTDKSPLNEKVNEKSNKEKSIQRKSSFNSFRLFGSSKVLSKLSSSSKTTPEDEQKTLKSKSFTSPRLKRSFFGLRKNSSLPASTHTTAVQTDDEPNQRNHFTHPSLLNRVKSKSSELLNDYYHIDSHLTNSLNKPELLQLTNKLIDYDMITPTTPDAPRKPTMGISALMTNKRRSSSVSCDKVAIEHAFHLYNEKMNNRVP